MPLHDWTRVDAGVFHAFHHLWIGELTRLLQRTLPPGYYALPEQVLGAVGPDVLTLQHPDRADPATAVATATATLSRTVLRQTIDPQQVRRPRRQVVVRHKSGHRIVAVVEIVSPGNKSGPGALEAFRDKVLLLLQQRIHVLLIDLFPVGPHDPEGVCGLVAEACASEALPLPTGYDRVLAGYRATAPAEVTLYPLRLGDDLPAMTLPLLGEESLAIALETSYAEALAILPPFLVDQLQPQP
jgi:hypothetical protein